MQLPALLADWFEGRDTNGRGVAVDDDLAWRPERWRRVIDRIAAPPPNVGKAQMLALLRDQPESLHLAERLSLFGHTRLPITRAQNPTITQQTKIAKIQATPRITSP